MYQIHSDIKKLAQKYTGILRSLKLTYVINNFLNRNHLQHNKALYKKYEIKKSIYSPLGRKDVSHINHPTPWLDNEDALDLAKKHEQFQKFTSEMKAQIKQFVEEGYLILKGFLDVNVVNEINVEVQKLMDDQKLDFNYGGKKIVESYKWSPLVNEHFFRNRELLELLEFLLGRPVIPFHTINFLEGSEQRAHSDSIHMATAPEGFMIAAWVALENTDAGNGPLFFYPGTHRLPYISCLDYDSGNSKYLIGENSYKKYENYISELIKEQGLKKEYFHAEPGDLLIWHANLLHGGDPIFERGRSRKSMVAHYFGKDVLCFHEISQRPALLNLK
ncbi:phytanoyl-CoA dioxygenase family protein [Portibacter marinus]|uniref:phytanoyl-CoA dioxygenase family protein n=1 Tax=Portibacter marinus TaxID=2898660 RepID=UPI001F3FBB1E|nr:phytanoyl-CoA dioxygenase family protein [Portibacter marinus]